MVNYTKLWKLLIDKNMTKKDLMNLAHLSTTSMSKLTKNKHISTEILFRICYVLNCNISDILDFIVKGQK